MAVRDILLLGDPRLYDVCAPVAQSDLPAMKAVVPHRKSLGIS